MQNIQILSRKTQKYSFFTQQIKKALEFAVYLNKNIGNIKKKKNLNFDQKHWKILNFAKKDLQNEKIQWLSKVFVIKHSKNNKFWQKYSNWTLICFKLTWNIQPPFRMLPIWNVIFWMHNFWLTLIQTEWSSGNKKIKNKIDSKIVTEIVYLLNRWDMSKLH